MIPSGWDLVLIARSPLVTARFQDVQTALDGLLRKADLLIVAGEQGEHVR
jgi:RNase P protein component